MPLCLGYRGPESPFLVKWKWEWFTYQPRIIFATTMLSNSEFVVIMKQSGTDSEKMEEVLNVSAEQLRYVMNAYYFYCKKHGLFYQVI